MLNRVVAFFISGISVNLLLIASPITANAFYQEDTVLKTVLVFNFITGEEPVKNKIIEILKNNEKAKRIVEGAQKLNPADEKKLNGNAYWLLGVADNSFEVDNRDFDYERNPIAVTHLLAQ